jgi:hypothetical protein
MILDKFLVLSLSRPNALGELVSFSQILLAFAFAPFVFDFRGLLCHLVRSCRSIGFLVRFPVLSRLILLVALPLPRVCFSSPGMSLSIVFVPRRAF